MCLLILFESICGESYLYRDFDTFQLLHEFGARKKCLETQVNYISPSLFFERVCAQVSVKDIPYEISFYEHPEHQGQLKNLCWFYLVYKESPDGIGQQAS